jgi:hypothetical protein
MRIGPSIGILVGILAMVMSSGCSDRNRDTQAITIDNHVFEVPRDYLIDERIPWLPQSEDKGLLFHMNPEATVRERISVLIESTSITCSSNMAPIYGQLAAVCEATEQKTGNIQRTQSSPLEKQLRNGDPTQWVYRIADNQGNEQGDIVATCSAMGDGNGLCYSLSNYADLVYRIGLRESEIERLPAIRERIRELLSSWEKPSAS